MTAPDQARAVWRARLGSAFRTALACAMIGCTTLYGPEHLQTQLPRPAFSYLTAILIMSDATLGDSVRGCWHALCATVQVVPASVLSLWPIGPGRFSEGVAAVVVASGAFLVAVPESSHLMTKRIAFGQIVIVFVWAVVHGRNTGDVMYPIHVGSSTALGALASLLALLLPYPRLASFEVRKLSRMYSENAAERISLFMEAFTARDNTSALESICQAKPYAEKADKLLQTIKLTKEAVPWERPPQIRPSKPHLRKPGERFQQMEIPIRGMEMALTSFPSFPVGFMDQDLNEALLAVEEQIELKLDQPKCFLPADDSTSTAPEPKGGEVLTKFLESLKTINPDSKDLAAFFFLSCVKLLLDDDSPTVRNPTRVNDKSEKRASRGLLQEAEYRFKRIIWPKKETLVFAFKCSLSLGLAVFFGLLFDKANGYWSGLTIAMSFAAERQATVIVTNARAQGMAIGLVYGVLGCFFFTGFPELKILALLPWIVFSSFLRHSQMYGQAGGMSAVIGALLILGRKNYGPPAEFAIAKLTEACIGLVCFITVELLLRPTRAATLAKRQLSWSLGTLRECTREVGIPPNQKDRDFTFLTWREKQEKLKVHVNQLEKFAREAELEPNFWFLPFSGACYNKLLISISKMVDLLVLMTDRMEFLVEESERGGVAWKELQEHINRDLDLFNKDVSLSLDCLERITLIKSFAVFQRETTKIYDDDLELGKSMNADASRMHKDDAEAEKIVSSFLQHSQEGMNKIWAQEGEKRSKSEMALCLSAIGFCISGLMRETKEIERVVKELVQRENPSNRMTFYEISCKINARFRE